LGEGDDDGLKDDKELSNKEIYNKDKEQGHNELARIHSPSCSSLLADTPKPNRWLRRRHGSRKNIVATLLQGWQDWRLSPSETQARPPFTTRNKDEKNQKKNSDQYKIT
jgi:hypothetical protein